MDNKISNYIINNKQKIYIISLFLLLGIETITFPTYYDEKKAYWYFSIVLLILVLYAYFVIFMDANIQNESILMKILYASPLLFLFYYNRSPITFNTFGYRDPETLLATWSYYQDGLMGVWILLVLNLLVISISISLFNIFWITRYKSYFDTNENSSSNKKWKRYNIIARIIFALSINSAFLIYYGNPFYYNFDIFYDFSGMSLVVLAFIGGGFYYVILDWFSEVLRLLSAKNN
tara:strand:- start:178 stop:879 length:702 start_codon:yes stop_codon:yes gene_type:complete